MTLSTIFTMLKRQLCYLESAWPRDVCAGSILILMSLTDIVLADRLGL